MTRLARIAHVAIGDGGQRDALLAFYAEVFGVVEVAEQDGRSYLASGRRPGYDVVVGPWDAGLDHFAIQLSGDVAVSELERDLRAAGLEPFDGDGGPGVEASVAVVAPSGHVVEFISLATSEPFTPIPMVDGRHFRGIGPVLLEHVTVDVAEVAAMIRFLERVGLRLTESVQPESSPPFNAFLRCESQHHDVAVFARPDGVDAPGLNHFCFAVDSVDALVRLADAISARGGRLESSMGRHVSGNNVFVYLSDPSGNRVEVNTQLAQIDAASRPRIVASSPFDAWRPGVPPTMDVGAPARDGRVRVSG